MNEAEARAALQNIRTPDHVADQARAVLAPIEAAERARKEQEAETAASEETLPPVIAKKRK